MNLLQIRTKFREISGRFDLVNEDFSDNGADFFINEGRKFLDRLDETQKSWGTCYRSLGVNQYYAIFPYCRAIKEVWVATTTARWQLEKRNLQDLVVGYLSGNPATRSSGTPLYYSPCISRYIPENVPSSEMEAVIGFVENLSGSGHFYNAVLLNAPASEVMTVMINGLFYSHELVNNTDENYWSGAHPMLLIMSAMRQLEIVNRNTQGVNDWTSAIMTEVTQLGMDLVEELIAEVDQMEG